MTEGGYYPEIYYVAAINYACTAEDLWDAVPFAPLDIVQSAAKLVSIGMIKWEVAAIFKGTYD
jgi:hypothetical protein